MDHPVHETKRAAMRHDGAGLAILLHFGPEVPDAGTQVATAFATGRGKARHVSRPRIQRRARNVTPWSAFPFPKTDFTQT